MEVLELAGRSKVRPGRGALHTEDRAEGAGWVAGRVSPSRDRQPLGLTLPLWTRMAAVRLLGFLAKVVISLGEKFTQP